MCNTIGHCKDCKYWKSHTDAWNKSWTECDYAAWFSREGTLNNDDFGYYADASDDQGLEAGMKTGPMFGCIKFMAKA
jgi:hypothetical protein